MPIDHGQDDWDTAIHGPQKPEADPTPEDRYLAERLGQPADGSTPEERYVRERSAGPNPAEAQETEQIEETEEEPDEELLLDPDDPDAALFVEARAARTEIQDGTLVARAAEQLAADEELMLQVEESYPGIASPEFAEAAGPLLRALPRPAADDNEALALLLQIYEELDGEREFARFGEPHPDDVRWTSLFPTERPKNIFAR